MVDLRLKYLIYITIKWTKYTPKLKRLNGTKIGLDNSLLTIPTVNNTLDFYSLNVFVLWLPPLPRAHSYVIHAKPMHQMFRWRHEYKTEVTLFGSIPWFQGYDINITPKLKAGSAVQQISLIFFIRNKENDQKIFQSEVDRYKP